MTVVVEAGDYGHPARDRRSLVPAHLLKPPDVGLDVGTGCGMRVQPSGLAPEDEAA
jgi:hypothetical protein